jgi:uncharacterized integral membrane protein
MSASAQTPGGEQAKGSGHPGPRKLDKRSKRELTRTGTLLVIAILITLFAVSNVKQVKVSYVFGSGKAPLIIVVVVSVLVGIVLAYFAERLPRRRRR